MSLDHPIFLWLLLLLPLELVFMALRLPRATARALTLTPARLRPLLLRSRRWAGLLGLLTSALFIAAISLGLAGPSWGQRAERVERSGLEVALVLDVSRSMEARDLGGSRLEAAKSLLRLLLGQRGGDSFSLVVAKGEGVLLAPMTEDLEAVEAALDWADPSVMSQVGTDLGRGILRGLDSFSSLSGPGRVLLLLSDGGDLGRGASAAALEARARGVRILSLGFGGPTPAPIPLPEGGLLMEEGRTVRVALEEGLLRSIAATTGGRYLDASEGGTLAALADELAGEGGAGTRIVLRSRDRSPLFAFIALVALSLRLLAHLFSTWTGLPPSRKLGRAR